VLFQDASDRSSRQSVQFGQLTDAKATLAITNHSVAVHNEFPTADMLTFQFCPGRAAAHAFDNKVALQFADRADDHDHRPTQWPGGVDLCAVADELDVEMLQFIQHFQKVANAACQPIKAPDHDHIEATMAGIAQHAIQPGPAGPGAGQLVDILFHQGEAALLHQLQQIVALAFRMLINTADWAMPAISASWA
jgi:hypothetical protein